MASGSFSRHQLCRSGNVAATLLLLPWWFSRGLPPPAQGTLCDAWRHLGWSQLGEVHWAGAEGEPYDKGPSGPHSGTVALGPAQA